MAGIEPEVQPEVQPRLLPPGWYEAATATNQTKPVVVRDYPLSPAFLALFDLKKYCRYLRPYCDGSISFDTEYTNQAKRPWFKWGLIGADDGKLPPFKPEPNHIICGQVITTNIETEVLRACMHFFYGKHIDWHKFLAQTIEDMGFDLKELRRLKRVLRILIYWHWGTAELGCLKERLEILGKPRVKDHSGGIFTMGAIKVTIPIDANNRIAIKLTFRDTSLLMGNGTALETLGDALKLPKFKLSQYQKEHMDEVLRDNPDLFFAYAFRDVEIAQLWILNQLIVQVEELHYKKGVSITTGMTAVDGLRQWYRDEYSDDAFATAFGWDMEATKEHHGRWTYTGERAFTESTAAYGYYGGCNQCYIVGLLVGQAIDADEDGCYAFASMLLRQPDWQGKFITTERDATKLTGLNAFALIDFSSNKDVYIPCLPIRTANGLVFPYSNKGRGSVWIPGPEIGVALWLGMDVKVKNSLIIPMKDEYLVRDYVKTLYKLRANYTNPDGSINKEDPRYMAVKGLPNNLVGKFGQGVSRRLTNDEIYGLKGIKKDAHKQMPYCPVTYPIGSAMTTSIARALLHVSLEMARRREWITASATTDGHMSIAPANHTPEENVAILNADMATYPLMQDILQARKELGIEKPFIELKHTGDQIYTFATRRNWIGYQGKTVSEARTGHTTYNPKKHDEKPKDYIEIADLINAHTTRAVLKYRRNQLYKLGDIKTRDALDITNFVKEQKLNLCYDWKRFQNPDNTTRPFLSMNEYWLVRRQVNLSPSTAWPDTIAQAIHNNSRAPIKPATEKRDRREIAQRIAWGEDGYRLPKGSSYRAIAPILGIDQSNISKLKRTDRIDNGWKPRTEFARKLIKELKLW